MKGNSASAPTNNYLSKLFSGVLLLFYVFFFHLFTFFEAVLNVCVKIYIYMYLYLFFRKAIKGKSSWLPARKYFPFFRNFWNYV